MIKFTEEYSDIEFVQQFAAQLPHVPWLGFNS